MPNETYTVNLTAHRLCRFDRELHKITCGEPLTGTLEELAELIPQEIEAELFDLGWRDGACCECAHKNRALLHAEHHADSLREMQTL